MTEDEVVAELSSGMTVGIGGWGSRRKPMSLVRAILRSGLTDLHVVSYGGPDVGLLCAAGRVRRLTYGFVSLDSIPLEPHFRIARQTGSVEAREFDEGAFYLGLLAAAHRVPFYPTRAGLGSDMLTYNPDLKTVTSPYGDGAELVAVPAFDIDVSLVHMNRADAAGNGQFLGPDLYFDDLFAMAAGRTFMSCERLVATEDLLSEGSVHTFEDPPPAHRRSGGGARGRPFHRVPARLRPRRGLPEGVRGHRPGFRGLGPVQGRLAGPALPRGLPGPPG